MSVGVLFPGQGSQFVGMGADLFDARPDLLGDRADDVLGWSLRAMCLDGPEEDLTRTEHAQPALFALGFALWDELQKATRLTPDGAAGHSLGEYTALTAAGVFGFETTLDVVSKRGRAMAEAADLEPSGMAALLGADLEKAHGIAARRTDEGGRLSVANINAPGQIVLAGGSDDIDWLVENAREMGVRRAVRLKVAGAFHSQFMANAAVSVSEALDGIGALEPTFPVWSNTTARPHETDQVTDLLARQVVSPVRFSESLEDMALRGIDTFIHIGPGDVTAGMAKRSVDGAEIHVISDAGDVAGASNLIGTMR